MRKKTSPSSASGDRAADGAHAEERVCRLLEKRGLQILDRNFRVPGGEIDIIACRPGELHFVEVRARSARSASFLHPVESIDARKQARIRRTAALWMARKLRTEAQVFLDVAAVVGDDIEWIVGAFE